jgi:GMP synthase-like glutamine amidotransferase
MRGLLLCNDYDADPGFIGEAFRANGYAFSECHRENPSEWPDLSSHDLVLMLGSDWSVFWEHLAAEVDAEASLVRAAVAEGRPVFGICYGAQMLTHALGGRVERAPQHEVGWYDIETDVPDAIAPGPWFEWHYDHIAELPGGATELARTARATQAFTVGRSLATQFHPEVDGSIADRWSAGGGAAELLKVGVRREDLLAETSNATALSRPNAVRLVDWFCESVAQAPLPGVLRTR